MALLDVFNVAGSAMSAQSVRLNTTASNLANAQSVSSNVNQTYRARHPVFAAIHAEQLAIAGSAIAPKLNDDLFGSRPQDGAQGVRILGIVESAAPLDIRHEPNHPLADENGYVAYPNVNVVEEMANMISASRSFQVNVQMLQSVKDMAERLLAMGR